MPVLRDAGRPDARRLHADLADRPGRHGQRLARPAQRRPLRRRRPPSSCSTRASSAAPARSASGARARILARLAPSPHRAPPRRGRVAERASPTSCSSTSRASPSTATATSRRLGVEARLRLFLDVLAAVAHAHANLIVHRDIKPSNVLVANGRPGEAPRLRHRQASRGGTGTGRSDGADARRRPGAHAGVRRAGAGHRRRGHDRDRRLRPGRAALRASDRTASGGGVAAIARGPPPSRSSKRSRRRRPVRRRAVHDPMAPPSAPGRPRHDRRQGAEERPRGALRVGDGPGRRRPALPRAPSRSPRAPTPRRIAPQVRRAATARPWR